MIITGKLDQPQAFDRFVLTARIAAGGMATVYLAEARPGDPLHGRKLAIKVLHEHLAEDEDFVRMFRDEGRISAQFDHPNIVKVFEVGLFEGSHFLVMEYVEGRDLAQLIQALKLHKQVMAPGITFEILRQALTALSYVHSYRGRNGKSAAIVHRDISPQNLLVSRHPLLKLTDFGIARGNHRSDRTRTGTIKGKMHYMAPEQAAGDHVDARADLYALGAVAFEMLTGQAAFGPGSTEMLHRRAMEADIDYGGKFRAQPEDVRQWLSRALARDAEERFQSADAMLAAMEQLGRASRTLYRPEALLRLLELPEARRSVQREARERALFVGDEAANLGRLAGAVQTGGKSSRPQDRVSSLAGKPQIAIPHQEKSDRLLNKPVVWDAQEPELRSSTDVRAGSPASAPTPRGRSNIAALLPAERVVGKSYAVADSGQRPAVSKTSADNPNAKSAAKTAARAAAKSPASDETPLQPHRFGTPMEEVQEVAPAALRPAAPARTKTNKADVDHRRGLMMAVAVAWMCGAFILFAVLLEVVGWTPELPKVDERAIAALFDGQSAGARSDGGAPSGPAAPYQVETRPYQVERPPFQAEGPGAQVAETPEVMPIPGVETPSEADERSDRAEAHERAERRARRLVDSDVERDLWDARPIERVIAADAPDPERATEAKAAKPRSRVGPGSAVASPRVAPASVAASQRAAVARSVPARAPQALVGIVHRAPVAKPSSPAAKRSTSAGRGAAPVGKARAAAPDPKAAVRKVAAPPVSAARDRKVAVVHSAQVAKSAGRKGPVAPTRAEPAQTKRRPAVAATPKKSVAAGASKSGAARPVAKPAPLAHTPVRPKR